MTPLPAPKHLFALPLDVVLHILAAVPTVDLVRLRAVSRLLQRVVDTAPCLWRTVGVRFRDSWTHWEQVVRLLSEHSKSIRKLSLANVRDDVLNCCWPLAMELEALEVTGWRTLSDHAFARLDSLPAVQFPKLRSFTLTEYSTTYCAVGSAPLLRLARGAPNLQHLHVWCNIQLDPAVTRQLTALCPKLQSVSLSSTQWHSDEDFAAIASGLKDLKYLALSHATRLTDTGLARVARAAPRLCTLVLHGARHVTAEGVQFAAKTCRSLATLKLHDCPSVGIGALEELGFESVFVTPAVKHHPCFRSLGLGFVRKVPPPPHVREDSGLVMLLANSNLDDQDAPANGSLLDGDLTEAVAQVQA